MTKSGVMKDARDTPRRRVRHRDGRLLKGGIGLTTGLGWSDRFVFFSSPSAPLIIYMLYSARTKTRHRRSPDASRLSTSPDILLPRRSSPPHCVPLRILTPPHGHPSTHYHDRIQTMPSTKTTATTLPLIHSADTIEVKPPPADPHLPPRGAHPSSLPLHLRNPGQVGIRERG